MTIATARSSASVSTKVDPPPTFQAPATSVDAILRFRVFDEPLVPVGGDPAADENAALAAALTAYGQRTSQDDFAALEQFVQSHPQSPWRVSLLTGLGLEYYNTAHYSKALVAWQQAWGLAKGATNLNGKTVADRALGELAYMYGRLGRMTELEALLQSVADRVVVGPATERLTGAREGLWNMQHRPEIAFRCGPQALLRIQKVMLPEQPADLAIFECASTQRGMSLLQVAALSDKIGLHYQMAFRESSGELLLPAVVHWKLGHYAAIIRQEGDKFLLQDATFLNDTWATRAAIEAESSGYFLVRPGALPKGWRSVAVKEGETVWGKGNTQTSDPGPTCENDPRMANSRLCKLKQKTLDDYYNNRRRPHYKLTSEPGSAHETNHDDDDYDNVMAGRGMAVSGVHLMLVNLNLTDTPVGYAPPVGPAVGFTVRYNHRDAFQPGTFTYANFGPKWTCDWLAYITDNPQSPSADVNYYARGGGNRAFKGFNASAQTFGFQQYDQTQLKRTGPASYEMVSRDGSKQVFAQSDGSVGTSRKVFLTQVVDPQGNTVTLNYDNNLRITDIVDAIGQATTLTYSTNDIYKIIRVTDPFGRFATFDYDHLGRLTNITDVIGMSSRFTYEGSGDYVNASITPYGTNTFLRGESGTTRWLETIYADGSRDRVEFNQSTSLAMPFADAPTSVPQGMSTGNNFLWYRNTYYWSRTACASSYGDYSKARVYHWLHTEDLTRCSGILESIKEPLEGRVWYDYAGQNNPIFVGANNRPTHIGRVLDDGSTQLYTYGYNGFGNVTNAMDPLGRTFSYSYDTNGIDLLEVRMTRAGKNELLYKATYNAIHRPLTVAGATGLFTTNTYNARGQLLTTTNPKGETTTYTYNPNGYLIAVDGPLPGTNDMLTATYDAFGRTQTRTDDSGYTVTLEHDALDRITKITFPDATFNQITYDRLDARIVQDRAGRQTVLEHNPLGQLTQRTDPLGRITRFQWCNCGNIKSLTDPMGRTTEWETDVQGRLVAKRYGDGSQVRYQYETTTSRLRQVIDEKLQIKQFTYNRDNTLRAQTYPNAVVPTPAVSFTYDPDYQRRITMTDGIGMTTYNYHPPGSIGAMHLAAADGPWSNDTMTFAYDELGLLTDRTINGVSESWSRDALYRITSNINPLGSFNLSYDGASRRLAEMARAGGEATHWQYFPASADNRLQQITHLRADSSVLSQFNYAYDPVGNVTNWIQQQASRVESWAAKYDSVDRLTNVVVMVGATNLNLAYAYDPADNLLVATEGACQAVYCYNALNQQVSSLGLSPTNATYEWDGQHRLVAIVRGTNRSEFFYDGQNQLRVILEKQGTNVVEERRFLWAEQRLCEERNGSDAVVRRFFSRGEQRGETNFYYFADHLGSVREITDSAAFLRAEYAYSPFGKPTQLLGDLQSTLGYTRLLNHEPSGSLFALFRVYHPVSARWLSRDPIGERGGLNLYGYVRQNPLRWTDPLGFDETSQESDEAKTALWNTVQGYFGANDLAGLWKVEIPWVAKIGNAMDIIGTSISVGSALEDPTAINIAGAIGSCAETGLTFLSAPIGVPIKTAHFLSDITGGPIDFYSAIRTWEAGLVK